MKNLNFLQKKHDLLFVLLSFLWVSIGFVFIIIFTNPIFANADDIRMSMTIHGYGQIYTGSPYLVYSHIIRGYLIQLLPSTPLVLGYSLETFLSLFFSAWFTLFLLLKFDVNKVIAFIVIVIIYGYIVEFPQFTITAGLLTASGALGLLYYLNQQRNKTILLLSTIFLLYGFIVRANEFVYVFVFSTPLLLLTIKKWDTIFIGWLVGFFILLSILWFMDYQVYKDTLFVRYKEFEIVRKYADYQIAGQIVKNDEIRSKYNFSKNDIRLIGRGFYFDENLINPSKLEEMEDEVNIKDILFFDSALIPQNLQILIKFPILPIFILSVVITTLIQKHQPFFWGLLILFVLSIISFTLLGRSGVMRIYYPVLASLVLFYLPVINIKVDIKTQIGYLAILIALVLCLGNLYNEIIVTKSIIEKTKETITNRISPNDIFFNWNGFDANYYYVLFPNTTFLPFYYDHSGVSSFFPYSVSNIRRDQGNGFTNQFTSEVGALLITSNIDLISIYCKEHYQRNLEILLEQDFSQESSLYKIRCITSQ